MTEFKIHVERIVRPIRASERRKNKMCEELMHHLISAHDDAISDDKNNPIALAIEGLGDSNALREELQDSIPRIERLGNLRPRIPGIDDMDALRQPSDTPAWKLALSCGVNIVILLFCLMTPIAIAFVAHNQWSKTGGLDWHVLVEATTLITLFMCCMGLTLFIISYLYRKTGIYKLVHCSSGTPAIIKGCIETLNWLLMGSLFLVFVATVIRLGEMDRMSFVISDLIRTFSTETGLLLIPIISVIAVAYGTHKERQQYEAWGHLDIDE
ncbi:MAG: hypothetical protein VCD00_12680 [Candidatus Hydrogenedentota bacterium]